jgi:hypothetical protein
MEKAARQRAAFQKKAAVITNDMTFLFKDTNGAMMT